MLVVHFVANFVLPKEQQYHLCCIAYSYCCYPFDGGCSSWHKVFSCFYGRTVFDVCCKFMVNSMALLSISYIEKCKTPGVDPGFFFLSISLI